MSKLFDLTKARKKVETKKFFMTILLIAIILYIVYAVYLTLKIPTDTIRVENRTFNCRGKCNRIYY